MNTPRNQLNLNDLTIIVQGCCREKDGQIYSNIRVNETTKKVFWCNTFYPHPGRPSFDETEVTKSDNNKGTDKAFYKNIEMNSVEIYQFLSNLCDRDGLRYQTKGD